MARRRDKSVKRATDVPADDASTRNRRPSTPPTMPEPDGQPILGEPNREFVERMVEQARQSAEQEAARVGPPPMIVGLDAARLASLLAEKAKRKIEALYLYEPLPQQEAFHRSRSRVRLVLGSNRSGKTEAAAFELARAMIGADPYKKFPLADGRYVCVGKDLEHLGKVVYDKVFRAGAIRIIRDEATGQWRNFRPWQDYDRAYVEKAKPAPPMIPPRLVKGIAWESKAKNQLSLVKLHNGTEVSFYTSSGKPHQGFEADGILFDEEILDDEWFLEMRARIISRMGRMWWSATPQLGGDALYDLHVRAEEQAHMEVPNIAEFNLLVKDNPYIDKGEIKALEEDYSEEVAAVRIHGQFAVEGYKVYPNFSMHVHGVDPFVIPNDWTLYAVVDPGHQVCAVLYAAVPPLLGDERCGDYVYLFDESYLRECDAGKFAEAMRQKTSGRQFQAFVMDYHYGVHTDAGTGKTTMQQYSEALAAVGVKSLATGTSFRLASDDIDAGVTAVRGWLSPRESQLPKLRVFRGVLPNFEREMKRYRKQRHGNQIIDKPVKRGDNHLMDDLRYLAMYNPRYVRPTARTAPLSGGYAAFLAMQKRDSKGSGSVRLGPGRQHA